MSIVAIHALQATLRQNCTASIASRSCNDSHSFFAEDELLTATRPEPSRLWIWARTNGRKTSRFCSVMTTQCKIRKENGTQSLFWTQKNLDHWVVWWWLWFMVIQNSKGKWHENLTDIVGLWLEFELDWTGLFCQAIVALEERKWSTWCACLPHYFLELIRERKYIHNNLAKNK